MTHDASSELTKDGSVGEFRSVGWVGWLFHHLSFCITYVYFGLARVHAFARGCFQLFFRGKRFLTRNIMVQS